MQRFAPAAGAAEELLHTTWSLPTRVPGIPVLCTPRGLGWMAVGDVSSRETQSTMKSTEGFSFQEPSDHAFVAAVEICTGDALMKPRTFSGKELPVKPLHPLRMLFTFGCQRPGFTGTPQLQPSLSGILETQSFKDKEEESVMCCLGKPLKLTSI